jgi:hypothetical protein
MCIYYPNRSGVEFFFVEGENKKLPFWELQITHSTLGILIAFIISKFCESASE